jgi:hypothetical protein
LKKVWILGPEHCDPIPPRPSPSADHSILSANANTFSLPLKPSHLSGSADQLISSPPSSSADYQTLSTSPWSADQFISSISSKTYPPYPNFLSFSSMALSFCLQKPLTPKENPFPYFKTPNSPFSIALLSLSKI